MDVEVESMVLVDRIVVGVELMVSDRFTVSVNPMVLMNSFTVEVDPMPVVLVHRVFAGVGRSDKVTKGKSTLLFTSYEESVNESPTVFWHGHDVFSFRNHLRTPFHQLGRHAYPELTVGISA